MSDRGDLTGHQPGSSQTPQERDFTRQQASRSRETPAGDPSLLPSTSNATERDQAESSQAPQTRRRPLDLILQRASRSQETPAEGDPPLLPGTNNATERSRIFQPLNRMESPFKLRDFSLSPGDINDMLDHVRGQSTFSVYSELRNAEKRLKPWIEKRKGTCEQINLTEYRYNEITMVLKTRKSKVEESLKLEPHQPDKVRDAVNQYQIEFQKLVLIAEDLYNVENSRSAARPTFGEMDRAREGYQPGSEGSWIFQPRSKVKSFFKSSDFILSQDDITNMSAHIQGPHTFTVYSELCNAKRHLKHWIEKRKGTFEQIDLTEDRYNEIKTALKTRKSEVEASLKLEPHRLGAVQTAIEQYKDDFQRLVQIAEDLYNVESNRSVARPTFGEMEREREGYLPGSEGSRIFQPLDRMESFLKPSDFSLSPRDITNMLDRVQAPSTFGVYSELCNAKKHIQPWIEKRKGTFKQIKLTEDRYNEIETALNTKESEVETSLKLEPHRPDKVRDAVKQYQLEFKKLVQIVEDLYNVESNRSAAGQTFGEIDQAAKEFRKMQERAVKMKKDQEEEQRKIKDAEKAFRQDIKDAEKAFRQDIKDAEKAFRQDIKDAEKAFRQDIKDAEKAFQQDIKDAEKAFRQDIKDTEKAFEEKDYGKGKGLATEL